MASLYPTTLSRILELGLMLKLKLKTEKLKDELKTTLMISELCKSRLNLSI